MQKTYVLDTNILLYSPQSIFGFEDNKVCITEVTVEELDRKKRNVDREVEYNARQATNMIKELRKKGNLLEGVSLPNGGSFQIITLDKEDLIELPEGWQKEKADNLIIQTIECYMQENLNEEVIFVTNDGILQIKADCRGIPVQDYNNERISDNIDLYSGRSQYYVSEKIIDMIYSDEKIDIKNIEFFDKNDFKKVTPNFLPNEFITLYAIENEKKSILLKYKYNQLMKLEYVPDNINGIIPLNSGQKFALEALLAPVNEIPLVFLQGVAGTSKTFLSLLAGLHQTIDEDNYKRLLICRPNTKFDDDIGFLKGTELEKITPLIRPFHDNLETILELEGYDFKEIPEIIETYFDNGIIKAEAMAYMRGRSITNTYIIVDEAQNSTVNQILGMITRAGKGSKIIILGDPDQIDNIKLDKRNNGLVFANEKMKQSYLSATVIFDSDKECKRSVLSSEASKLLKV